MLGDIRIRDNYLSETRVESLNDRKFNVKDNVNNTVKVREPSNKNLHNNEGNNYILFFTVEYNCTEKL